MKQLSTLFRLAAMRRRGGASVSTSLRWAAGLIWHTHQTARRRRSKSEPIGYERL